MRISDWSSDVCSSDLVNPRRIDAQRGEIIFRRIGAALTERDIIVAGTAFVGMAFQRDADGRVALQPLRLAAQRRLILGVDIILVEIKEDAVRRHIVDEVLLRPWNDGVADRSEGHTSELKSLMRIAF